MSFTKEAYAKLNQNKDGIRFIRPFSEYTLKEVFETLTKFEELKRDIARYFELDCSLTRDGVFHYSFLQTSKLENETIQKWEARVDNEFSELKEKLSKVGKEE